MVDGALKIFMRWLQSKMAALNEYGSQHRTMAAKAIKKTIVNLVSVINEALKLGAFEQNE